MISTHNYAAEKLFLQRWSEALATPQFQTNQVTLDSLIQTLAPAAERSFQRLIQALLREGLLDFSEREYDADGRCWLELSDQNQLCFNQLIPGRMGSWELRGAVTHYRNGQPVQKIQFPSQLLTLLNSCLEAPTAPEVLNRLNGEIDDSFVNDTLCLAFHGRWTEQLQRSMDPAQQNNLLIFLREDSTVDNPTLLLEQWGTLGHPWHPNYKTKIGLSTRQIIDFSPEFGACLPVLLCALHRRIAHVEMIDEEMDYSGWWHTQFPKAAIQLTAALESHGLDATDYLPLPVHPWQAQQQLPRMFASEISDRLLVLTDIVMCSAFPTMSFRTVVPEGRRDTPMIKLPVSMHLTSVQRTLSPRSARMGPRVSQLLETIFDREPTIRKFLGIIPERVGVHFNPIPSDDERSRHLAVLYRDSPLNFLQQGEIAIPVGSLFALDHLGQPLLASWVKLSRGICTPDAVHAFFRDYVSIALPGLLGIYLRYGVAFEAHQQNTFAIMSVDGQLGRLLLRDFGDIRIDRKTLLSHGLSLHVHDPGMTLFDNSSFVRDKLLHTLFMCHLGELALLCAQHFNIPQVVLWNELALQVRSCFQGLRNQIEPERWQTELEALLELDWPAKSFMRMRLLESHVDIVERLSNPLSIATHVS